MGNDTGSGAKKRKSLPIKIVKFLFGALLIGVALLALWAYQAARQMPDWNRELAHEMLKAEVKVVRDDYGVPHITAENETDAYFALGYCMGQDRLFQMEILRRLSQGRLAEIIGPVDAIITVDKAMRTFRLKKQAEEFFVSEEISKYPEITAASDAFIAGLNHAMETEPTPVEFAVLGIKKTPFTKVDSLSISWILPITFSYGPRQDPLYSILQAKYPDLPIADLFPGYTKDIPSTIMESLDEAREYLEGNSELQEEPPLNSSEISETFTALNSVMEQLHNTAMAMGNHLGSNSWVLAPQKTKSGGAILANDPHIGFMNPCIWYEAHMKYGDYENYGHHLPLIPIALLGHNRDRGWGLTMFANDDVDVYVEKVNPDDPKQVMYKGEWVEMEIETETINVRFGSPVDFQVRTTPHGPVITDFIAEFEGYDGPPIALWWVWQHNHYTDIVAFYRMAHARDLQTFERAVSLITSPGINVSYADKEGNIAWWAGGLIPVRPAHVNSKLMLEGWHGNDDILGYLPFEQNPHLINPPQGYIATANNKSTVKPVGEIPDLEGYWQPDDRAREIEMALEAQEKWDVEDTKRLQFDDFAVAATPMVEAYGKLLGDSLSQAGDIEQEIMARLSQWDGRHALDSVGATLFWYLNDAVLEKVLGDELNEGLHYQIYGGLGDVWNFEKFIVTAPDSPFWDNIGTTEKESAQDTMLTALSYATERLQADLGAEVDNWTWGRVHTMTFMHPFGLIPGLSGYFNIGPFPSTGSAQTINNMLFPHGQFDYKVIAGPSTRRVIDFSDPEHSYAILPTGNSGHFLSPHFDDQAEMFMRGEYRMVNFTDEQVEQHKKYEMIFKPLS